MREETKVDPFRLDNFDHVSLSDASSILGDKRRRSITVPMWRVYVADAGF
jgi:hypothetical protein